MLEGGLGIARLGAHYYGLVVSWFQLFQVRGGLRTLGRLFRRRSRAYLQRGCVAPGRIDRSSDMYSPAGRASMNLWSSSLGDGASRVSGFGVETYWRSIYSESRWIANTNYTIAVTSS